MRIDDMIGRRFGRYEVQSVLGRGGMAAVYRAHDAALRRDVALKVLYPNYGADPSLVERFKREAVLAAGLDHPNIVQIYDVGEEGQVAYIAMQLLPSRSLADLLRERPALPPAELVPVVDQIAAALDYAHGRGVVHRDIKAGNILLEPPGRAVLTDFGIAKSLDAPGLTSTGMMIGTPDAMAPEQIGNQPIDGRADVYALGVLAFRSLTGRRPFEGGTDEVLLGHLNGSIPDPSLIEPSLPSAIDPVIRKAMARRPEQRYQTAGEFARALRAAAGLGPVPAPLRSSQPRPAVADGATSRVAVAPPQNRARTLEPPPAYVERRPSQPGSGVGLVVLALVLLVVVGGGGFVLARQLSGGFGGDGSQVVAPTPGAPTPDASPAPLVPTAEPTAQPTAEPTAEPTAQPTVAATAAPTARPSATPSPTRAAPTATASPTVAPPTAVACAPITGGFNGLWTANATVRGRLDCAIAPEQGGAIAQQPFERGSMFWFEPTNTIYVLLGQDSGRWVAYPPDDQEGIDAPPAQNPPAGLFVPQNGFGTVWGTHSELPILLGWATEQEEASSGAFQPFREGQMLFSQAGLNQGPTIYVLYENGEFERFDDPNG